MRWSQAIAGATAAATACPIFLRCAYKGAKLVARLAVMRTCVCVRVCSGCVCVASCRYMVAMLVELGMVMVDVCHRPRANGVAGVD